MKPKPDKKLPQGRRRGVRFHITATEEEAAAIRERMAKAGITDMGAYARRMMISGYHITLDLSDVREMAALLGHIGGNINQIAKRANETRSIYAADIEELKRHMDEIWGAARGILSELAKIK